MERNPRIFSFKDETTCSGAFFTDGTRLPLSFRNFYNFFYFGQEILSKERAKGSSKKERFLKKILA
ncbi:Hypothetical protein Minf_0540 [Methylacidiphilum infernorum V4]|uniref:Uncharacterized protein n=1 Tax=Methylacidiphilum infernorum (isolate V4) TaxID=481448 RepID=B3DZI1_METI4|nr:Hypothetical protein Minf_0540 [Methylacidiphilum infernorum V4]